MKVPKNWSFSPDSHNGSYDQERGPLNIHVTHMQDCHANIRAEYQDYSSEVPVCWSVSLETLESISKRLREVFPQSSEIEINLGDEYIDPRINVDWSEKQYEWSESTLANVISTRILKVLDEMEIK